MAMRVNPKSYPNSGFQDAVSAGIDTAVTVVAAVAAAPQRVFRAARKAIYDYFWPPAVANSKALVERVTLPSTDSKQQSLDEKISARGAASPVAVSSTEPINPKMLDTQEIMEGIDAAIADDPLARGVDSSR